MAESLRELIYLHLIATLQGVTILNGYSQDVGTVTRGLLSPQEQLGLPIISLLPVSDTPEYGAQVLRRLLTFTLRVWIDDMPADAPTTLENLLSDVQAVLAVDVTRGGLTEHTLETGVNYLYAVATERINGADLTYECHYRTTLTDPRTGV